MYPDLLLTKQKRKRKKRWPPSQDEIDQAKAKFFEDGGQVQDMNIKIRPYQEPAKRVMDIEYKTLHWAML
tara:strand:+ start:97 stop:306 length:210 start_codon:yes stop_codon:yes gene_type:complete